MQPGGLRAVYRSEAGSGGGHGLRVSGNRRQAMLSSEDNDLLCRVGRGTPMGELLRHYWMPVPALERAARARRSAQEGPPARARTWWRSATRRARSGCFAANCPHRGASLFFGRNEEVRTSLLVPRLEVGRARALRRHAERAGGEHLQGQGARARLSVPGRERRDLDLHGTAADGAARSRRSRSTRCPPSRSTRRS